MSAAQLKILRGTRPPLQDSHASCRLSARFLLGAIPRQSIFVKNAIKACSGRAD